MRGRFSFILLVIFGSFCVYCAQNVVGGSNGNGNGGNGGGGMVGSAGADTCCTPPDPPAGTVLFDKAFTVTNDNGACVSPTIDVAGSRTIVLHGNGIVQNSDSVIVEWTFGGVAGWVGQAITSTSALVVLDGRLGKQVRVYYGSPYATNSLCGSQQSLTVVGYKQ